MNILALQSDYPILSLSRLSAPVKIVERTIVDLRIVESLRGTLIEDDELMSAMVTDEQIRGTVVDDEAMTGTLETDESVSGEVVDGEDLSGDLECE
jgi:hypothetical protein